MPGELRGSGRSHWRHFVTLFRLCSSFVFLSPPSRWLWEWAGTGRVSFLAFPFLLCEFARSCHRACRERPRRAVLYER